MYTHIYHLRLYHSLGFWNNMKTRQNFGFCLYENTAKNKKQSEFFPSPGSCSSAKIQSGIYGDSWAPPSCHSSVPLDVWICHWNCLSSTILTYEPGPRKHTTRMKYFCDWKYWKSTSMWGYRYSHVHVLLCVREWRLRSIESKSTIFNLPKHSQLTMQSSWFLTVSYDSNLH